MDNSFEGIFQLGKISNQPEDRLRAIKEWLDRRVAIVHYVIGNLIDLWYGPFEECDSIKT